MKDKIDLQNVFVEYIKHNTVLRTTQYRLSGGVCWAWIANAAFFMYTHTKILYVRTARFF